MCSAVRRALLLLLSASYGARAVEWTADDFTEISRGLSPRVAWAAKRDAAGLHVAVEVETERDIGSDPRVTTALAAGPSPRTDEGSAKPVANGARRFETLLSGKEPRLSETDWKKLRFAFTVQWPAATAESPSEASASNQPRQIERFRTLDARAPHASLDRDPLTWEPLDLEENAAAVVDRRNRSAVDFTQPMAGKATIVIEDAEGQRVRNLIAGRPMSAGPQRIEWDGLDEAGRIVQPGEYRWRAISHPGITPDYLFSFCNDGTPPWRTGSGQDMWGPDHSTLQAAAAGRDWTFFAGSVAESGYAIVAIDHAGRKQQHYQPAMGTGIESVQLAVDGSVLYAAHDGFAWGDQMDRKKPDWKAPQKMTLSRFDAASGKLLEWPGGRQFARIAKHEIGPGSSNPKFEGVGLAGLAVLDGRVFVSDRAADAILVLKSDTAERIGEFKLEQPGPLAIDGTDLLAVSGENRLVRVNTTSGQLGPFDLDQPPGAIRGLTLDSAGNVFLSDGSAQVVRVYNHGGKFLKFLGKAGGAAAGPFDPMRLVNPRGLAVAGNGWLWVTEDRWKPKRLTAWNTATGEVLAQKFGPTSYGANGAGFDPLDHTRWIGQGALWQLDFKKKSAACRTLLSGDPGHDDSVMHYTFVRQDGRTFVISLGKATGISELLADGSLKPLAAIAQCHTFSFAHEWKPPRAFIDAFNAAYPEMLKQPREGSAHAEKGPGMMWVDLNGDGAMQAAEFNFSTDAESFAGSYWGHDFRDLTLRVPAQVRGKRVLVTLKPDGFHPTGAPKYPSLNAALARAVPIDLARNEIETATDRFGNLICNSDPEMKCFDPDGRLRWSYPNRWSNVHGSHDAPLPEIGVLQGALFFLGMTPLDEESDVFVINGNHGRFFALTSDGLYLDEFFKDTRMGGTLDAQMIGGECFGGFFARSEKDGEYYLQSGHTDYRIFRLRGLREARRSGGKITVSPAQALAAANNANRQAAVASVPRETVIPRAKQAPKIDGNDDDWPEMRPVEWDRSGKFPARLRASYDATNLYLCYDVRDDSPWVNRGKDATLLFKTGDSVDLQLGVNAEADPKRAQPVAGDLRLLIAPFESRTIAVLYQHRLPGAKNPQIFTSPWRSEKVDSVRILDAARIAVKIEEQRYRVEAAIPLSALFSADPADRTFAADFGVLHGDPSGAITLMRSYWSNQATNLVNDVPGEIMLSPQRWGRAKFEGVAP